MMPAIPNSFFIAKQMKKYIEDKVIIDFTFNDLDKGKYNVFNISEEKTAPFIGKRIVKADSNFIVTENGWLCEFGFSDGALRYSFRSKFPLEVGDKYDFTFENYKGWLADNGKTTILEAMVQPYTVVVDYDGTKYALCPINYVYTYRWNSLNEEFVDGIIVFYKMTS